MRLAGLVYALFIAVVAAAIIYAGPVTQFFCGHDHFSLLEGGWKIVNGARPYLQFSTQMGPCTHLLTALGVALAGPTAYAFPAYYVTSLLVLAPIFWLILAPRFNPMLCALGCTYLALVWVAPFPMHFEFFWKSYAMNYNRQSSVMLCLLALVLLLPRKAALEARVCREGFWVGLLLALLLFFKVTYFAAGLILLGPTLLFTRVPWTEMARAALGFMLVTVPMTIFLRGWPGLAAMVGEWRTSAVARESLVINANLDLLERELPGELLLVMAALVTFLFLKRKLPPEPEDGRPLKFLTPASVLLLEFGAVLLAAIAAEMGGSPLGSLFDMPLLVIYCLILWQRLDLIGDHPALPRIYRTLRVFAVLAVYSLVLPLWFRCFLGVCDGVAERKLPRPYGAHTVIDAPGFKDMHILGTCGQYPRGLTYVDKINDGLNLIRKHPELNAARIASLDFTDAFSAPRGEVSPSFMPTGLQYGTTLNEKAYPSPEKIFTGCDALMIPAYPEDDARTVPLLLTKYHSFIESEFIFTDRSQLWSLYERKPSGVVAAPTN